MYRKGFRNKLRAYIKSVSVIAKRLEKLPEHYLFLTYWELQMLNIDGLFPKIFG